MGLSNLIFALCFAASVFLFGRNVVKIKRNILLGQDIDRSDNPSKRWLTMAKVTLGGQNGC